MNTFLFTCGDINGIGLEIIIKSLNKREDSNNKYIIISPANAFTSAAEIIKPKFQFEISNKLIDTKKVLIYDIGYFKQSIGQNTKESGEASFIAIKKSFDLLKARIADAVVTAPISKTAINKAGINFPGHTEMYAYWCGTEKFVMMFLSKYFNAALLTIHEPISKVPLLIDKKRITDYCEIIYNTLKNDLGILSPKIAVLGLNPHAGESGIIGTDEKDIIIPALKEIHFAEGPFSPDAFFANKLYDKYDCILGMYHDQILIPFKMLNFSSGVNFTAGLPIVRTSPDHGTAFDIAGKGIADESSMTEALEYAELIISKRKRSDA